MQRQVFGPVGVTDARCAPVRDAMLMYLPLFGRTAPASLLRVLEGLVSGRLLSVSQRELMDDNCLGWDCSIASQAGYRGKYGCCCGGSAGLQISARV